MIDSSEAIVITVIVASLIFVVIERQQNKQRIGRQEREKKGDPIAPDQQPVEYRIVDTFNSVAKRVIWWSVKIVCGGAAILGTFYSVFSAAELFFLLSGRIVPDFEQPPASVVSGVLAVSLVLMIVGYKAPKWLNIDRLI